MVAVLDRTALGPLGDTVSQLLSSASAKSAAAGAVDLTKDVRVIRYCKLAEVQGAPPGRFVMLMAGSIPADAVTKAASAHVPPVAPEFIDGVPILGGDRGWTARRGLDSRTGELVTASDRDLLGTTLFSPSARYATDPAAPLSLVMAPSEIRRVLSATSHGAAQPASLAAIRELRVSLLPGATSLLVRFAGNDAAHSTELAEQLKPVLAALVGQMAGRDAPPPQIAVNVEGPDVLARIEIPPVALQALANQYRSRRGGGAVKVP